MALASERVQEHLAGKDPLRVIYVPGKLVNLVVR
jgi:leucyl-tRNA synthetase